MIVSVYSEDRPISAYLYRCPNGHERQTDTPRAAVICQRCTTGPHVRMTLVPDSEQ